MEKYISLELRNIKNVSISEMCAVFDIDEKQSSFYLCVFSFQFLQIQDRIHCCCFKDLKFS